MDDWRTNSVRDIAVRPGLTYNAWRRGRLGSGSTRWPWSGWGAWGPPGQAMRLDVDQRIPTSPIGGPTHTVSIALAVGMVLEMAG